jgi:signal peptidase
VADLKELVSGDLLADVARQFGEVRLKVTGTSMLPSVWPGDILTVRRQCVAALLSGRIILCYRNHGFVAHRLVRKLGAGVITRGDTLPCNDLPFRDDEVLGEVVGILRNGRPVALSRTWWHTAGASILRHSDFCTRILLRLRRLKFA